MHRCKRPHWTAGEFVRRMRSHASQTIMDFDLTTAVPVLERTPAALEALLDGLPAGWTDVNEGADSWTVHEIVAHLIHGEHDDWVPRARHLLQWGTSRPFAPFDRTF